MRLVRGRTYYKLTYSDPALTMPGVEPMVYIGKNAFLEVVGETEDTYQFQDTVSFVRFGYVTDTDKKDECFVEPFRKEQLGTDILTLEQAHKAVGRALVKSRKLKEPRLKVSKGKWFTARVERWVEKKIPNER